MKVLVTGASGFLGGFVCEELVKRGHEVGALVRRDGSQPPGTKAFLANLRDSDGLSRAVSLAEPECVIHLAAEIASQRDPKKIAAANVGGTGDLILAAEAAGVRRIVFTSTVVTGDAGGEVLTEETALPVKTIYGRSKQEGERMLRNSTLEDVIIRPSHIYGPGGWFVEEFVIRLLQPGRFAVIGSGRNWWDVVQVEDVAAACVEAAENAPAGSLYHVVDDEPITYFDFVALAADALGVGPPRRIPAWLARLAAGGDTVRAVTRSARSSNARIKAELDWQPRFPSAREGVPDAISRLEGTV
ncbi:MAG: NAD-dependent epimerase/dehydratase family protein [Thermoleophilia bacterium]|nr:NAD-dependent epimerase/dehydratase family protein [Thermoleophilia bacterium]